MTDPVQFPDSPTFRAALAAWGRDKELLESPSLSKREAYVMGFSEGIKAGLSKAVDALTDANQKRYEGKPRA